MPPQTLEESINKAMDGQGNPPLEGEETIQRQPASGDQNNDDVTEETKVDESIVTTPPAADPNALAIQLYEGLNDPSKAPIIIKFLAEQAGYIKPAETPKEVAKQSKGIEDLLREGLGTEFDFLAPKLAKPLEQFFNKALDDRLSAIDERVSSQERLTHETEASDAIGSIVESYFPGETEIPENVSKEMSKMIDRYPPSGKISTKEYLNDIFAMAAGKLNITPKSKTTVEKINRNRNDVPSQLNSFKGGSKPSKGTEPSKPMSLTESIDDAIEKATQSVGKIK